MVKYIRGTQTSKIEEGVQGKMRLHINDEDPENIWIRTCEDGIVIQNHAFNLYPFSSWGAIVPKDGNLISIRESMEITLHPEAYDEYLKQGIIDAEGNFILPKQEEDDTVVGDNGSDPEQSGETIPDEVS